jgi:hypothetical protein
MKNTKRSTRPGSVLALVVVLVILLILTGIAMLSIGLYSRLRSTHETRVMAARAAADAGLAHCRYLMNRVTWATGQLTSAEVAVINGQLATATIAGAPHTTYSVQLAGTQPRFVAVSTGTSGPGDRAATRRVHANLSLRSYWWGIGVERTIDLVNHSYVGTQPPGGSLELRTNSIERDAIAVNTPVLADAVIGVGGAPGYAVKLGPHGEVDSVTVAAERIDFPIPPAPVGLPNLGALTIPTDGTGTISSSGQYTKLDLNTRGVLTISGDVTIYVTGEMTLGNSAIVKVEKGSSLKLYLGTSLSAGEGSQIQNRNYDEPADVDAAKHLFIYGTGTCTKIDLKNSGVFCGAIDVPTADITIYNSVTMIGAIIGKSFIAKNGVQFYYDMALADVNDWNRFAAIDRWWED